MKYVKGGMRAFRKIKVSIKPYVKRVYHGQRSGQRTFFDKDKAYFDLNFTVPEELATKGINHVKKNKGRYVFGGHAVVSAGGGYIGARMAQRKGRKKR